MNLVMLIGRLTKDPDLRYTTNGKAVCSFNIAVDREYKNSNGEKETDFFKIVVWGKAAENCGNYLSKGRLVAVKGSIHNRVYKKDDQKRYTTEILAERVQFLEYAKKDDTPEGFLPADDNVPF
ncbi:MAG: single-stranded DNA-binding protein [Thermosipho sp. (in: Bacteria)]|nr:single-stranded DNA-binding protein [Thermosipho sp. (in: thermotogales)]